MTGQHDLQSFGIYGVIHNESLHKKQKGINQSQIFISLKIWAMYML